MPIVSVFFGISISMFHSEHGVPHFHAESRTANRLVATWARAHESELLENWRKMRRGTPPVKIAPLV